ncbi:MAG: thermonuclease family protein [Candidatus Bipolaricaulaceae bacterium]
MSRKILVFGALVLALAWAWAQPPEGALPARITRWRDGDTADIRMEGVLPLNVSKYETVRLLGINAPEVGEPWSEEATRFFRKLTMGKTVYVELNPWERRDIHGRLLAYLWVETGEGWTLVNEALLRAGLAQLFVHYPEREPYYCRFLRALALAQLEGLGLWENAVSPRALWEIEADIVRYVTQAVCVVFEVSRVGLEAKGWALWAGGSRYGLRVVLQPEVCRTFWSLEGFDPGVLIGKKVVVTGVLSWDRLQNGPSILVHFPEQLRLWEEP